MTPRPRVPTRGVATRVAVAGAIPSTDRGHLDPEVRTAERLLHDRLLDDLGDRRRGPVRWGHAHGYAAANEWLAKAYPDPIEQAGLVELRRFLASDSARCVLVVGMCDGVEA